MPAAEHRPPLAAGDTAGLCNALTDVAGIRVGHATRIGAGALTGTTVILVPPGSISTVYVLGGAPSTRETAALDLRYEQREVDGIVLTGGSSYGLATAHGALSFLADNGAIHTAPDRAPLVPAAALFDLGRGGDFHAHPAARIGAEAAGAALASAEHSPVAQGNVGAGTGAVNAELKGGLGTASVLLPDGVVVAALAAINAHGPSIDPNTGLPYAYDSGVSARASGAQARRWQEFPLDRPSAAEVSQGRERLAETVRGRVRVNPMNTVIGIVATNARLSRAQTFRLSGAAHDGLALAVRPAHCLADGDTVFAVATGQLPAPTDDRQAAGIIGAGARVFSRALVHGILAARSVTTPWGHIAAYHELYPSAVESTSGAGIP